MARLYRADDQARQIRRVDAQLGISLVHLSLIKVESAASSEGRSTDGASRVDTAGPHDLVQAFNARNSRMGPKVGNGRGVYSAPQYGRSNLQQPIAGPRD